MGTFLSHKERRDVDRESDRPQVRWGAKRSFMQKVEEKPIVEGKKVFELCKV
jgi:hypothetical protein